jgi:predicted O-methyltransferase YrrM
VSKFQEIIAAGLQPEAPIQYYRENGSIRIPVPYSPYSLREAEFEFLRDFIATNKLQCGFELGNAFGVSTVGLGLGFKESGGHLISMDAYTEEKFQAYCYQASVRDIYREAVGYKSALFLMKEFGLEDTVDIIQGWSPTNTEGALKTFTDANKKLDFVFIDAMHDDQHIMDDVTAIMPFLADKFAFFFHDVHCFSHVANDFITGQFGMSYKIIDSCRLDKGLGYNLALINRLS